MTKIEAGTTIARTTDEVWNFMLDVSNGPKWIPGQLEGKVTSDGPIGVGSRIQVKNSAWPHLIEFHVMGYEPGRKITMDVIAPQMMKGSTETFAIEGAEGRTNVTLTMNLKLHGLSSLLGPFVMPSLRKGAVTEVGNLKRILESGDKSESDSLL